MPAARIDVSIAPNSGSGVGHQRRWLAGGRRQDEDLFTGLPRRQHASQPVRAVLRRVPARARLVDRRLLGHRRGVCQQLPWLPRRRCRTTSGTSRHTLASNSGARHRLPASGSADHDPQTDTPVSNPGDYFQTPSGRLRASRSTPTRTARLRCSTCPVPGSTSTASSTTASALLNADGGCDLQSLYQVPDSLGTSSISADRPVSVQAGRLPGDDVVAGDQVGDLAVDQRRWRTSPRGRATPTTTRRIVVAHAQDIDGSPFAGEVVCFSSDSEEHARGSMGPSGSTTSTATSPASDPKGPSLGRTCVTTDDNGNAAVEVLESNPGRST